MRAWYYELEGITIYAAICGVHDTEYAWSRVMSWGNLTLIMTVENLPIAFESGHQSAKQQMMACEIPFPNHGYETDASLYSGNVCTEKWVGGNQCQGICDAILCTQYYYTYNTP